MSLIRSLISYIENNSISYDDIAEKIGISEDELKGMIFVDGDLYLSELDEILEVLNISYADLSAGLVRQGMITPSQIEGSLTMVTDGMSDDEKNVLKQVMEAIESVDSMIKANVKGNYMN
jgi:hypothetical protein